MIIDVLSIPEERFSLIVERGSPGFESFLEILGERIRLKGWDKYRGGLDVKGTLMT